MKASHGLLPVFDDENLVSSAGLVPVLRLAEKAGLSAAVGAMVRPSAPNVAIKARTLVAGMIAGADSIDDLDVLRSGATGKVIGPVRAPSTMGTFLRAFTHGHVEQVKAASRRVLAGLVGQVPAIIGGDELVFVDTDDTIEAVYGRAKQGAGFGYSGVRGLNALIAMVSTPSSAPLIVESALRRGSTRSGKSAAWHLKRALTATTGLLKPGQRVWVRADSAFCTHKNVAACTKAGATYSFTIPAWPTVTAAISRIDERAWTPIHYPHAVWDEQAGGWVSDAQVAETDFLAFTSHPKSEQVACRLIIRRVKRLNPQAGAGQDELFATWRYHAFITNTTTDAVAADQLHRDHAIVEQTIAELKAGPLAHMPSGKFAANAAWLAFACLAHNLARAAAVAAGMGKARMATITRTLIATPARLAHTGRRLILHLPAAWPWARPWANLWATATSG